MTSNLLLTASEWLTAREAAELLTEKTGKPVTEADVLQAGREGQLPLSVFLPENTVAICWKLDEATPPPLSAFSGEQVEACLPSEDVEYDPPTGVGIIDRIWSLPMVPPGTLQVEDLCNTLRGLPHIRLQGPHLRHLGLEGPLGAFLQGPDTCCILRADGPRYTSPSSVLPAGTKIVLRRAEVLQFAASSAAQPVSAVDKPLVEKEWKSEAIIVAALAAKAGIDLSKELFKAAGVILSVVHDQLDLDGQAVIDISDTTIWNHLKRMNAAHPEALQRTSPGLKKTP